MCSTQLDCVLAQGETERPRDGVLASGMRIPRTLSTVVADRVLAAWQDIGLGEMFIHLECVFDARLDENRLARACELALDAEPVLGCRFAVNGAWPRWERIERGSRPAPLEVVADRAAYDRFLANVPDQHTAPQAHAALWHAPDGDRLALKMSHAIADAGGTKDSMRVIADAYRRLGSDASYVPAPNLSGSRSIAQVFRALPLRAHPAIVANTMRMLRNKAPVRRIQPEKAVRHPFGWVVRHVDAERTAALAAYGKEHGATLNDLFVAAALRAIAGDSAERPGAHHRLQITVDLRRYLRSGRAGGICNLSAFDIYDIGTELGGSFAETLAKVSDVVSARKRNWLGLLDIIFGPLLAAVPYRRLVRAFEGFANRGGAFTNALTNLGPITTDDVDFGVKPRVAHLLPPVLYPPMFGAGLSGYAGTITFALGAPVAVGPRAERFLDGLLSELPASH
jgi:NRPS condensation-like uncharacterized protein